MCTYSPACLGWDTHFSIDDSESNAVADKWAVVNGALTSFVSEMKAQGIWDNITVVVGSEFGRTIDSNGGGTDHGNYNPNPNTNTSSSPNPQPWPCA